MQQRQKRNQVPQCEQFLTGKYQHGWQRDREKQLKFSTLRVKGRKDKSVVRHKEIESATNHPVRYRQYSVDEQCVSSWNSIDKCRIAPGLLNTMFPTLFLEEYFLDGPVSTHPSLLPPPPGRWSLLVKFCFPCKVDFLCETSQAAKHNRQAKFWNHCKILCKVYAHKSNLQLV